MSPEAAQSFLILALGFAFAGTLATGYQLVTAQPPSFLILGDGMQARAVVSVAFLTFAAPFIIMRNTIRGRRLEGRNVGFVMIATVIAGFWSLMSGTVFLMMLEALGILQV
jgi:hypothetical protein